MVNKNTIGGIFYINKYEKAFYYNKPERIDELSSSYSS